MLLFGAADSKNGDGFPPQLLRHGGRAEQTGDASEVRALVEFRILRVGESGIATPEAEEITNDSDATDMGRTTSHR